MSQHRASILDGKGKPFTTRSVDTATPGSGEILVKVSALAINPVDWKVQNSGYFVKDWPSILGEDVAGTVRSVGDSVKRFKEGDRVLAHSIYLVEQQNKYGGFQEYVIVREGSASPLPDNISFDQGAVLPLAISTAAAGLFQPAPALELPLPSESPQKSGKSILIWGGSSSVGTAAIQLAKAAGVRVVTTASKRNHDFLKKLGADVVIDYNEPGVVGDLTAALREGEFAGAYDAIATPDANKQSAQVVAQFGGGRLQAVLAPAEDIPATVQAGGIFALTIFTQHPKVGKAIWEEFLPKALASGQLIPAPEAQVVGHGIDAVPEACAKQKAGVSAKKIVVTL